VRGPTYIVIPNIDLVQEFKVVGHDAKADYGGAMGRRREHGFEVRRQQLTQGKQLACVVPSDRKLTAAIQLKLDHAQWSSGSVFFSKKGVVFQHRRKKHER
jgi:hypothetical protein